MLKKTDPFVSDIITKEIERQETTLEMIPSENHTSKAVREALGSVLTDKYSEGYPGKRYYAGLEHYDVLETECQERVKKLFGVVHANVQPYSGSPANHAVYFALAEPGDTVMGMALPMGGHLTHGWKVNFSAKYYNAVQYGVTEDTQLIDYDAVEQLAKEHKPKLIWAGATAYPRIFDWERFRAIADAVDAYLIADIAHIAGLVLTDTHPCPVPYAHVVTSTTHKTLRGPRGGLIMVTKEGVKKDPDLPKKIDKAVFPALQGGPHQNQIAAVTVCLKEAAEPAFKAYGKQIIKNAQALAAALLQHGFRLVTNGTDNHLLLVDLRNKTISGSDAQDRLEAAGITCNKNSIPYDPNPPFQPSGIRLGTPALTTRGMQEKEMQQIASWINEVIADEKTVSKVREEIKTLCKNFPLP